MNHLPKWVSVFMMAFAVSSCGLAEGQSENAYKISPEGAAETKNRNVYQSLGDVTFYMNQRYKITMMNGDQSKFHYLIANVKKKVGDKVEADDKGALFEITDGSHIFDCDHYYDVKISKEDEVVPPVCEFELVGTIYPDGKAKLHQPK